MPIRCGFCGAPTVDGWVAVRRNWPAPSWDVTLEWEAAEGGMPKRRWRDVGKRGAVALLSGRLIKRRQRRAALCFDCGATVIYPRTTTEEADPETSPAQT